MNHRVWDVIVWKGLVHQLSAGSKNGWDSANRPESPLAQAQPCPFCPSAESGNVASQDQGQKICQSISHVFNNAFM